MIEVLKKSVLPFALFFSSLSTNADEDILEVKVGVAAPMTGPSAHLGKDIDSGARMAFEQVNNSSPVIGGKRIKFKVITVDDQSSPQVATQVAYNLIDQKVVAVIGHLNSGATIPASRIYAAAGIPQISPASTNPIYTHQGFKTAFRNIANDTQQSKAVADFAFDQLKARKIAVIDDRTAAGQGQADMFVDTFRKRGGIVLSREYTTNTASDFTAILTKIKKYNPDIIYFGGMDAQAGPLAKQMKQLRMNVRLLGSDGMQSAMFIQLAKEAAVGNLASSVGLPRNKMPNFKLFEAAFTAKYGEMQTYAPYSYDAAMILIQAMKEANSTNPAQFVPKISSIEYHGVTGVTRFDANGDIRDGAITIYAVSKDGKWLPWGQ